MIGDNIRIKEHHKPPAKKIVTSILSQQKDGSVTSLSISGESGCGKSTLSLACDLFFKEQNKRVEIFHMDDYFFLPPKINHLARIADLGHVGISEVNFELLQSNLNDALLGKTKVLCPLVHYDANKIEMIERDFDQADIIIVEGTYTSILENIDHTIFMSRDYHQTLEQRKERARDEISEFSEQVLKIEHEIISNHRKYANIIVNDEYEVAFLYHF